MKSLIIGLLIFLLGSNAQAQQLPLLEEKPSLPLRALVDSTLQRKLQFLISDNSDWRNLVEQKKMAIGLVDLSDIEKIRFARVNGNEIMYAASLPKIAVLLAAMDAIDKNEIEETAEIKKDLHSMINRSNNQATTRMIDRIGFDKIEKVLTSNQYHLYDEETGGGLWVGKRYAAGGKTKREPIKNLSHAATVTEVCRFYYLLYKGELVNPKRSKQMMEILENSSLHHKFISVTDRIAPRARIFRKSGTWQSYHSDSMLVWGDSSRRYILVALVNSTKGEKILRKLVEPIEQILEIEK